MSVGFFVLVCVCVRVRAWLHMSVRASERARESKRE